MCCFVQCSQMSSPSCLFMIKCTILFWARCTYAYWFISRAILAPSALTCHCWRPSVLECWTSDCVTTHASLPPIHPFQNVSTIQKYFMLLFHDYLVVLIRPVDIFAAGRLSIECKNSSQWTSGNWRHPQNDCSSSWSNNCAIERVDHACVAKFLFASSGFESSCHLFGNVTTKHLQGGHDKLSVLQNSQ